MWEICPVLSRRRRRTEAQCRRAGALARRYASLLGAGTEVVNGLHFCSGLPSWAYPRGGITVGDTYLTGGEPAAIAPARLRHEQRHREQWQQHGYRLALLYPLAGRNPRTNRFEVAAGLVDGGYVDDFAPPPQE